MASQTLSSLMEENRMMNSEMNRLEDLLSQARAERDDIGIKYQAVSDRVSTILTSGHRCSVMKYTCEYSQLYLYCHPLCT